METIVFVFRGREVLIKVVAIVVPTYNISDNIIISQEAIHTIKNTESKQGFMIVKVDLEKAYNRVRWDFLEDTLYETGLLVSLIRTIVGCVTSSSMQLLWNGALTDSFTPTRGVRQGSPIHISFCSRYGVSRSPD